MEIHAGTGAARIAYFSGTGGVKRIANAFLRELVGKGLPATVTALEGPTLQGGWGEAGKPGLLILLFAVHAFDAPEPVYTWVRNTDFTGVRAAVLSVSGGGEVWPNTGCRAALADELAQKGALVCYDRMLVMPSNVAVDSGDHGAMHLLAALPRKVQAIADDLLAGRERHDRRRLSPIRRWFSSLEKRMAHRINRGYRLIDCTGCGWCEHQCPTQSIVMKEGKPVFQDSCVACLRCVYSCPQGAIKCRNFLVLKKGYGLDELEKRMEGVELKPVEQCCKGAAWAGVREYLLNPDK